MNSLGYMFVGTLGGGAYRSIDNGVTWTAWGLNGTGAPAAVMAIAYTSAGSGTYYMATTSGLYRMPWSGGWTLVDGGNGYAVGDVEMVVGRASTLRLVSRSRSPCIEAEST